MSSGGGGSGATDAAPGSSPVTDFTMEELEWVSFFANMDNPDDQAARQRAATSGARISASQVETIQKLRQDRAQRLQASRAAQAASTKGQMPTPTTTSRPSSTGSRSAAPATMRDIERQTETQFLGV